MERRIVQLDADASSRLAEMARDQELSEAEVLQRAVERLYLASRAGELQAAGFRAEGATSLSRMDAAVDLEVLLDSSPLPAWQQQLLDQRLAEDDADPAGGAGWPEVKQRILASL